MEFVGRATSPGGMETAGFVASTTIDRTDWDLTWNQVLETGGVLVGDQVDIDLEMEATKVSEEEAVPA